MTDSTSALEPFADRTDAESQRSAIHASRLVRLAVPGALAAYLAADLILVSDFACKLNGSDFSTHFARVGLMALVFGASQSAYTMRRLGRASWTKPLSFARPMRRSWWIAMGCVLALAIGYMCLPIATRTPDMNSSAWLALLSVVFTISHYDRFRKLGWRPE